MLFEHWYKCKRLHLECIQYWVNLHKTINQFNLMLFWPAKYVQRFESFLGSIVFLFVLDVAGCVRVVPIMLILDPVAHRGLDPGPVLEDPIAPLCSGLPRHPRGFSDSLVHCGPFSQPAHICHKKGRVAQFRKTGTR